MRYCSGGAGGTRTQEINTRLLSAIPAARDRSRPTPARWEGEQVPGGWGERPLPNQARPQPPGTGTAQHCQDPVHGKTPTRRTRHTGSASAWHMSVAGRGAGVAAATVFLKASRGECSQPWLWAGGRRGLSSLEPLGTSWPPRGPQHSGPASAGQPAPVHASSVLIPGPALLSPKSEPEATETTRPQPGSGAETPGAGLTSPTEAGTPV